MWKLKTSRHHADHAVFLTVEHYALINDTTVAAKASLPESVAQHHGVAFELFIACEQTAYCRLRFKHAEKIRRDDRSANSFGFTTKGEVKTVVGICSHR